MSSHGSGKRSRWFALWMLGACACEHEDGRFPCGSHGGRCDAASEVCVVGGPDQCSTCVPLPAACEADMTCGCLPPGTDPAWGAFTCEDAGMCGEVEGGLVLSCEGLTWTCG